MNYSLEHASVLLLCLPFSVSLCLSVSLSLSISLSLSLSLFHFISSVSFSSLSLSLSLCHLSFLFVLFFFILFLSLSLSPSRCPGKFQVATLESELGNLDKVRVKKTEAQDSESDILAASLCKPQASCPLSGNCGKVSFLLCLTSSK